MILNTHLLYQAEVVEEGGNYSQYICINVFGIFRQIEVARRAWEQLFVTKTIYSMNFHVGEKFTTREQQCEYMVNAGFVENYSLN